MLGLLVLVTGVFTLSLEAKTWLDSSQHHLAKHYKATDSFETPAQAVLPPVRAMRIERPLANAGHALPPPAEQLPGIEPCLHAHLLRAPPSQNF